MGITGIRFSTEKHLPAEALDDLIDAVGWGRRGATVWAKICERSSLLVTAWEDEKLVGMGRALDDGMMGMIYDVAVHPRRQGRGIGRAIMQRITNYLEQQSLQSVGLFAWDKNPMTGPFYKGFGFTRVDFGMRWDPPAKD